MPITRKFRATIMERALGDPAFRRQMLIEAVNSLQENERVKLRVEARKAA